MSSSVSSTGGITRYWGLASGLNVESIVKGLTSDIQDQLDTAKADQQKLEWKQTAYRDVISTLNAFEKAYTQLGESTSMMSSEMYTAYSVSSTNNLLTATATSAATGAQQDVEIRQSALTASLIGSSISKNRVTGTYDIASNFDTVKAALAGNSFNMTVDDLRKSISFTNDDLSSVTDADGLVTLINNKLDAAFGTVDGQKRVTASLVDGKLSFVGAADYQSTYICFDSSVAAISLGINQLSNRTSLYDNLGSYLAQKGAVVSQDDSISATEDAHYNFNITLNGKSVTLNTKTMTVKAAIDAINEAGTGVKATYNTIKDNMTLSSTQSGSTGKVEVGTDDNTKSFFKTLGIDISDASTYTTQAGRDAIISVNGTNYARSSNKFAIDGVSYSINGDVDPSGSSKSATLTFNTDTTKLEKGLKDFISAYNSVVNKLTTYINTKPDKDEKYEPLTDAQKEKMTADQIDKWNAKADDTVLFNDSTLSGILNTMRSAIYQSVKLSDGSTFALYDIGITTSDDYEKNGEIEIKDDDLQKFKDSIATNANKIAELFTKQSDILLQTKTTTSEEAANQVKRTSEEGIINRLDDLIKRQTGFVYGNYGALIQIAGTDTYCTTNNFIYNQLKDTKDKISDIKTKMSDKQDALYKEFQTLESYMSTANAQSSMLTNMLGSK